ncbi:MAG: hypothetical protein WD035_09555 [Balneolaceae bacterium]
MMKTLAKKSRFHSMEPVLTKVLAEAEHDHDELENMFKLMGWENLPVDLKIEIKEDVKSHIDELNGFYSTCDPFVQRRRESVDFWVRSYQDGICTLDTAVKALRIRS